MFLSFVFSASLHALEADMLSIELNFEHSFNIIRIMLDWFVAENMQWT